MSDESTGFTRFRPPAENSSGEWYVRSEIKDSDGLYYFLAHDEFMRPYVGTINRAGNYLFTTKEAADAELVFYYAYHGAPELYPSEDDVVATKDVGSQVMDFIP